MRYLTNIKNTPENAARVQRAAQVSGRDIRFHPHPMPPQDPLDYYEGYDPTRPEIACLASIARHDDRHDCSEFWRIFEALE